MANLLRETKDIISENNKKPEDIVFIGSPKSGHTCTWEEYLFLADKTYNNSYGSAEVAGDLTIIFKDGSYMTRGEYDGSEWWDFHNTPALPLENKKINTLFGKHLYVLETMND